MIVPLTLKQKYDQCISRIDQVGNRAKQTIMQFCEQNSFAFLSRRKTLDSLAEKIETGRYEKWSDLDDLFACTIIIPNLQMEKKVIEFCRSTFKVLHEKKRGIRKKSPDVFRFDSTRLICKLSRPIGLPEDISDVPSDNYIYNVPFEVQVRSAFEHAWIVSTHPLTYKSNQIDWRKLRLAAQIKAVVEQLDMLIIGFEEASNRISESPWPEVKIKKLVSEFIKKLIDDNKIPSEVAPKDLSRFCDNFYRMLKGAGKDNEIRQALKTLQSNLPTANEFPRSISLLQFVLGVLTEKGFLTSPLADYFCHVTPELLQLYPSVKQYTKIFNYDQ